MTGSRDDEGEMNIARWLCDRMGVVGRLDGWMVEWIRC